MQLRMMSTHHILCRACALQRLQFKQLCSKLDNRWSSRCLQNKHLIGSRVVHYSTLHRILPIVQCAIQPMKFTRCFSSEVDSDDEVESNKFASLNIELDWNYISKPENYKFIKANIDERKGVGDIDKLIRLLKKLMAINANNVDGSYTQGENVDVTPADFLQNRTRDQSALEKELWETAIDLPNQTHPDVCRKDDSEGSLLSQIGEKREYDFKPRSVIELGEYLNGLRVRDLTAVTGPRSYYLTGSLAMLEQALVKYTTELLSQRGFKMMSVPNLIYPELIEGCGFKTTGERNQIFHLDPHLYGGVCLAGTGEMPLAGFVMDHGFAWEELPQKIMTVSKCYRAEVSDIQEEKGIYRVHQFTKVEMFSVTSQENGNESQLMMDNFLDIQKELFSSLGLCIRVVDMPAHELGAPAYRKYDLEAWMPDKQFWGEISSTSNCTDYQSRRLDIRYWNKAGNLRHCHTVNGTACAVPRLIMALLETYQQKDKSVLIPKVLQPYMDNLEVLMPPEKRTNAISIKLSKNLAERMKAK